MYKIFIQKVKTKNLAKITPHSAKRPVFLAVTGLFLVSEFEVKKNNGGAAGYCLRVRFTTWIPFYVRSLLFCLGKRLAAAEDETAKCHG